MESAYLYVRVSTDEQARKGFSLPEQEDRLLKYCEFGNIEVKGIYREDYSAKNFNRPEWKKLIATIKKDSGKKENNILFIKWDRFSRNIEYAYEMIGILRKYRATAMAIDQPIDFTVPESTVMLAVYLSIPEAENSRRALNTSNGMRRAKLLGRYPNKAPLGFTNCTGPDEKKYIIPAYPEADIIKWAFKQLAKNSFKIEVVRRMACAKGLVCSRSGFWKLVRNPVYCGFIPISTIGQAPELIKAVHEPLISETLFYEVQSIINTRRKVESKSDELGNAFFLRGFLICPACGKKLSGSFSRGSTRKYPYYHCFKGCPTRIRAELVNNSYNEKLQKMLLLDGVIGLFNLVLEDENIGSQRAEYLQDRRLLKKQLEEQQLLISKARKLFVTDRLKFDDFKELKLESQIICSNVGVELSSNASKLRLLRQQLEVDGRSINQIFYNFLKLNILDKKYIVSMIPPKTIDINTGTVSIQIGSILAKILSFKKSNSLIEVSDLDTRPNNFRERKVTIKSAISLMGRNGIQLEEGEAGVILDFLYHMARTYNFTNVKINHIPKWISNQQKPAW
ncbi:recombinase family protein [Mucilaginibacter conchicola]|uniref:Recombinase family protein n=1 Tax=Mucilaginibacter conchicola TaxID=2303333 RepID=A0A372NVF8_9SPHI|nr:recombinase family protein [Mucilaginibacter conchicola]RFZ94143.1 recombinase family protein [Mucilaginibacter conchicola]